MRVTVHFDAEAAYAAFGTTRRYNVKLANPGYLTRVLIASIPNFTVECHCVSPFPALK